MHPRTVPSVALLAICVILASPGCGPTAKGKVKGPQVARPAGPTYPAPKITTTRRVSVDALAYVRGKLLGVMHPVRISVGPNTDPEPNVGISGDLSGGLGSSWRAGVWMAAYQASTAVGRDLTDFAFQARGYGNIDGASASALFTAGMMAAILGVPIRKGFTMTGTVNPDGTVGPVGGIPNKFRAAIRGGKRLLGYPVGQRFAKDYSTKRLVDLRQLAAQAGARAVEVATIYDAFRLLTGVEFPRPEAVPKEAMDLPRVTFDILKKKTLRWARIFNNHYQRYRLLGLTRYAPAAKRIDVAIKYVKSASNLLKEGSVAPAYDYCTRGGAWAFTTYWFAKFVRLVVRGELNEMLRSVLALRLVQKSLAKNLAHLRTVRPNTVSRLMVLVAAYEQIVEAWVYARQGEVELRRTVRIIKQLQTKGVPIGRLKNQLFKWFYGASFKYALAQVKQAKARDFLDLHQGGEAPYILDPARLVQVAKILMAAAKANLVYFESMFVPQFVKGLSKSPDWVKGALRNKIAKYLQATWSLLFPKYVLAKAWGANAPETAFAQMAGAMGSYFNSSMLITKYYSLKLSIMRKITGKQVFGVSDVPRLKALVAMLKHAEENARMNAALAKKYAGGIPVSARVFYHIGMTMKEMQASLKIKALEMFWRASMECQLAVLLSRR